MLLNIMQLRNVKPNIIFKMILIIFKLIQLLKDKWSNFLK